MTDETQEQQNVQVEYVPIIKKRSFSQKLGCSILILLWFIIMVIPFFFIVLAIEEEITLKHSGDIPDKHEHPLLQVKLVMEIDFRGLSITNSSVQNNGNNLCLETHVRYLLWQGKGDNAQFCDCYTRVGEEGSWQFESTSTGSCSSNSS